MGGAPLDTGVVDGGVADMAAADEGLDLAAPDMAAPDMMAVESPIDCAALCPRFQTECPEAFAIHGDCDDCELLSAAFAGGETPLLRTAADICVEGVEGGDCRALYTCLVDPDGLHAVARGVSFELHGTVGGVDFDFAVEDAFAAVGVKNDGGPSDLELSFTTPDGAFLAVKFDDLPAAIGRLGFGLLDASDNEVQVELPTGRVDLDDGLIEVTRFTLTDDGMPAGFELSAEVRESADGEAVIVRARGTFE